MTSLPSPAMKLQGEEVFLSQTSSLPDHPVTPPTRLPLCSLSAGKGWWEGVSWLVCQGTGQDRAISTMTQDERCFVQRVFRCNRHYLIYLRDNNRKEGRASRRQQWRSRGPSGQDQDVNPTLTRTWITAAMMEK